MAEVVDMTNLRVLVVEDEPGMLDIMRVNLEHAGYEVVPARDGVEGWQKLDCWDRMRWCLTSTFPRCRDSGC